MLMESRIRQAKIEFWTTIESNKSELGGTKMMRSQTGFEIFIFGIVFLMVSWEVLAGPIPEPTPGLPDDESIAYQPRTTPTIDGDLSDWEKAAFKAIDKKEDLLRGDWGGTKDLSYRWSCMWDDTTFYFAAAMWDDILTEPADANQPWLGDCLFLYIDANVDGVIDNKPSFFLMKGKPAVVKDWSRGGQDLKDVEIAIVMESKLGKGGRIYEVAFPYNAMQNMKPKEGDHFRMMPGHDEGSAPVAPGGEAGLFMDWGGLNPDEAGNLKKVTFGKEIRNWAVSPSGKLTTIWGKIK